MVLGFILRTNCLTFCLAGDYLPVPIQEKLTKKGSFAVLNMLHLLYNL